jgi:transglutaminase-like putative cysteine protease
MSTYRIQHVTRYTYDESVPVCHNLAHLRPRSAPRHEWHGFSMEIEPEPATRSQRTDYFGNTITFFAIQEPHHELSVATESEVTISAAGETVRSDVTWETARDGFYPESGGLSAEALEAFQYTFSSPCIQWNQGVREYAQVSFTSGRRLVEAVLDLTRRIQKDFVYDTKSTTISTTLPEILKARAGVCQDFAHLQIGCLRAMGLAARYVSGYLLTTPPPGQERLVGADASHAWLSVFVPDEAGGQWLDLDPTNNVIPTDKHITIGWGRDFGDVSPLRGVIFGGRDHTVEVSVDVTPVS